MLVIDFRLLDVESDIHTAQYYRTVKRSLNIREDRWIVVRSILRDENVQCFKNRIKISIVFNMSSQLCFVSHGCFFFFFLMAEEFINLINGFYCVYTWVLFYWLFAISFNPSYMTDLHYVSGSFRSLKIYAEITYILYLVKYVHSFFDKSFLYVNFVKCRLRRYHPTNWYFQLWIFKKDHLYRTWSEAVEWYFRLERTHVFNT